jgi:REP element-mobilizing transposase RayT
MREDSANTCRHSIRLQSYDYAQEGMYFFTVCTHNRQPLFGNVMNAEMKLNEFGRVVWDEWRKSVNIRREIELDAFIVMPNHAHGIAVLKNSDLVGATGRSPLQRIQ